MSPNIRRSIGFFFGFDKKKKGLDSTPHILTNKNKNKSERLDYGGQVVNKRKPVFFFFYVFLKNWISLYFQQKVQKYTNFIYKSNVKKNYSTRTSQAPKKK